MNRHAFSRARLAGHAITIALATLLSTTLLLATTLDHTSGGNSELQDALRTSEDAAMAQAQARAIARHSARLAVAASAICQQEHGPGALPRWTPDGELLCLPGSQQP